VTLDDVIKKLNNIENNFIQTNKKNMIDTYFHQTERLLYHYSDIKIRIDDLRSEIRELKRGNIKSKSKSILSMRSGSTRLSADEQIEELIKQKRLDLERNNFEVKRIDKALLNISDDEYYEIIKLKYFGAKNVQKNDEEIAQILYCDKSTVSRNKNRLIKRLSVLLFGAEAI
jgi:beta-lactamase class D